MIKLCLFINFATVQSNNVFTTQQQSLRQFCSTTLKYWNFDRSRQNATRLKKHIMQSPQQQATTRVFAQFEQVPDMNPSNNNTSDATLVSTSWLYDNLQDVIVLDVRGRVEKIGPLITESGFQQVQYIADKDSFLEKGHIPTARFVDWREIKVGTPDEIERFCEDVLSPAGVYNNSTVVVYDWGDMLFSARLWLALKIVGCENVALLNGGWMSWNDDMSDCPVSYDSECPLKLHSNFEASSPRDAKLWGKASVGLKEMQDIVDRNTASSSSSPPGNETDDEGSNDKYAKTLLVDARSKKQYSGVERRNIRSGHIPTAMNLPYRELLNENGIGFRADEDIKQKLTTSTTLTNNNDVSQIVCYCNGGVASSLLYFCLVRHGFDKAATIRNYCGSFNEWANLPELPVEQ